MKAVRQCMDTKIMMLSAISQARREHRMGTTGEEEGGQDVGVMGKRGGHERCSDQTLGLDTETAILKS